MGIALVTGANKGIGFEIAKGLAAKGLTVIIGSRDEAKGKAAAEQMNGDVRVCQLDVTDATSVKHAVDFVTERFGKLDVLVNNAGILIDENKNFQNIDRETLNTTLEVNFFAPLKLCQLFLPLLRKSADARIVNMASGLGQLSDASGGYPAYRVSKTALNCLTVNLAAELKDSVKVNSMCPGWVRTDMGGKSAPRTPEQGADTAIWLAIECRETGGFFRNRERIEW